jgi:hypothetical protein
VKGLVGSLNSCDREVFRKTKVERWKTSRHLKSHQIVEARIIRIIMQSLLFLVIISFAMTCCILNVCFLSEMEEALKEAKEKLKEAEETTAAILGKNIPYVFSVDKLISHSWRTVSIINTFLFLIIANKLLIPMFHSFIHSTPSMDSVVLLSLSNDSIYSSLCLLLSKVIVYCQNFDCFGFLLNVYQGKEAEDVAVVITRHTQSHQFER